MAPAPAETDRPWVVLRAASLHWCSLQLPSPVVALLALRADLPREERRIAFLGRGEGVVRVVSALAPPPETARELSEGAALGYATPTTRFLFTLPRSVQRHLGLRTYPRIGGRAHGTDDRVAWIAPSPEGSEPLDRVYLARSHFRGLLRVTEPELAPAPTEVPPGPVDADPAAELPAERRARKRSPRLALRSRRLRRLPG